MMNELLRHTISTIKYRFDKSIQGSSKNFETFSLGKGSRSPIEILHHMFEVIHFTRIFIEQNTRPKVELDELSFEKEIERFNSELKKTDLLLANQDLELNYSKKLIQGPFSDLLTHIGQIAMLQRLVDNPISGEDFSRSEISTGLND